MFLQKRCVALYICLMSLFGLVAGQISCSSQCETKTSSKYCNATAILRPPWSTDDAVTAPKPTLSKPKYYLFLENGDLHIALNISWSCEVAMLHTFVEGFYLSVTNSKMSGSQKYRLDLHGIDTFENRNGQVHFNYMCLGRGSQKNFIRPGHYITVDLQTLPLYQSNLDSQHATKSLRIPDCDKDKVKSTLYCLEEKANSQIDEDYYEPDDYDPTDYLYPSETINTPLVKDTPSDVFIIAIASAFGSAAFIALFILGFCIWRNCKKGYITSSYNRTNQIVKGSCLVLVSSSSEDGSSLHKKAAHLLAEILNRDARLQVSCNLWLQTQMQEPVKWTTEALAASQHVVLVASHQPRQSCQSKQLEEPFEIGLAALLQSQRAIHIPFLQKQTFHLVYFAANRQQVLPRELSSFKRSYPLMKNFRGFYKALTNRPPSTVDPQLRNSLSDVIARLRHLQSLDETSGLCPDLVSEMKPAALDGNRAQDANMVLCLQGDEATSSSLAFNSGFSSSSVNCWSHETSVSCQGSQCSCNFNSVQEV